MESELMMEDSSVYQESFEEAKKAKIIELVDFQARENAHFIQSQLNFYSSFLTSVTELFDLFDLPENKVQR